MLDYDLDADMFAQLADIIHPGISFELLEGLSVVGSGVIQEIEEQSHR